ncbi:OmpA family protein [Desulfomarina profundi]|nr:OmpA family protein [Desulfomarina profundi]
MHSENLLPTDNNDDRNSSPGSAQHRKGTGFVNIERRIRSHTVFHIDEFTSRSSLPRPTHWSIAWSDLMMTMFILFLAMFVYQSANEEFLGKKKPEILGGDTTEALDSIDASGASFPFIPIKPGLPIMTAGTIKKVVKVPESSPAANAVQEKQEDAEPFQDTKTTVSSQLAPKKIVLAIPEEKTAAKDPEEILEPRPLLDQDQNPQVKKDQFQEIFTLSKDALESNNLEKFATIDLVPDKTMRIILTGDLLFGLGESELSTEAKKSLKKIAAVIRLTPYMINIVGHTDNIPMRSNRFKSNWELSVARASTVARFFIDNMGMNPSQFVVSGYSSYRPVRPNTTAENRAKNRRVEIIISKRLPQPLKPTAENLK